MQKNQKEIKLAKVLSNGVRFTCEQCGNCCRAEGEIYIYSDDVKRILKCLNLKTKEQIEEFSKQYLKIVNDNYEWFDKKTGILKTYKFKTLALKWDLKTGVCVFLNESKSCLVYKARPFQCDCFPFWQVLISDEDYYTNYSKSCKGLQSGKGRQFSPEEIIKWARKEQKREEKYFLKFKRDQFDIYKTYPWLPRNM